MTKKAYNIDVGDLQVEDDGRTVILPIDVKKELGLKENDKIVLKKIARGNKAVFEITTDED
jgi:bifunctional DNA-binding transcriptional regulator/antitoxin component of YhaV-PrlF toxin-antitoxin module|tara:strand:+ start:2661 stop:2843 length:183 start_codon:yes stop_codon:yes gene_type:complete